MADYQIIDSADDPRHSDLWRLFDCPYDGNPDHLPADSTLRRVYVQRLKEGKPTGWGFGLFFLENGMPVRPDSEKSENHGA